MSTSTLLICLEEAIVSITDFGIGSGGGVSCFGHLV